MPAANYNFVIEQGSDFEIIFQYNDPNNNPIDLSNKCVVLQWLDDSGSKGQVFSTAANANYNINDWSLTANNLGTIRLRISANITKNYNFATAIYDLDIISQGARLRNVRLATGTVTIVRRNISLLDSCPSNLNPDTIIVSPTPTPLPDGATPTPTVTGPGDQNLDLCLPEDCVDLDIYSVVYTGSSLELPDLCFVSGSVITTDTREIENIEVAINKLQHTSPQDLVLIMQPPSGDPILLSANTKIPNMSNNFSFMFSNKASSDRYLFNTTNGGIINIYDKTNDIKFSNHTLTNTFNHLFGASATGNWTLYVKDTDPLGSGYIDSWKLIVTYAADQL